MASEIARKTVAVMAMAEMFGRQLTEPAVKMYLSGLNGISADAIEKAACQVSASCKFMPAPVELRELAGESRPEDRAALAWEVVIRAISSVGGYRSPDFDDPYINGAIKILGGWVSLCDQKIDEQDRFTRANFCKAYSGLMRTGISDELSAPLVGIAEKHNATHQHEGYDATAKVRTGLPWAGQQPKRLEKHYGNTGIPRIELKKP